MRALLATTVVALTLLTLSPAEAADLNQFQFVFGLKDPALRTNDGAEALRQRLRKRLVAARVADFTLKTDHLHQEVVAKVQTKLDKSDLLEILTARGTVEVLPVVVDDVLLKGAADGLGDGVSLDWRDTRQGGDLFLSSASRSVLAKAIARLALADYLVLVGRSPVAGSRYRTFLVGRSARPMGGENLRAVKILDGIRPNYHSLVTYWSTAPSQKPAGSDVVELTAAAKGGTIVLVVDGEVETSSVVVDAVTDGEIRWEVPDRSAHEQYLTARKLAGKMASGAHPCDIVLVTSRVLKLRQPEATP